jgi:hypothetical protein
MKNIILKLILKIIRSLIDGMNIVIAGRSSVMARVYRAKNDKWSEKIILDNKPRIKF